MAHISDPQFRVETFSNPIPKFYISSTNKIAPSLLIPDISTENPYFGGVHTIQRKTNVFVALPFEYAAIHSSSNFIFSHVRAHP